MEQPAHLGAGFSRSRRGRDAGQMGGYVHARPAV
jgi:hypothetical protein